MPGWSAIASIRCSVETYSSFSSRISFSASRRIWTSSLEPPAGSGLARALELRQRVEGLAVGLADGGGVDAELAQHRHDDPAVLLEQDGEQVLGHRLRVAALVGQLLRGLERLLGLDRKSVWLHAAFSVSVVGEI